MNKKDIEKLFRDKLGDFRQIPEDHVWDSISSSLDKKRKKRRILPLWWQIGGAAAIIIAGIFLFQPTDELPEFQESVTKAPVETSSEEMPTDSDNFDPTKPETNTTAPELQIVPQEVLSNRATQNAEKSTVNNGLESPKTISNKGQTFPNVKESVVKADISVADQESPSNLIKNTELALQAPVEKALDKEENVSTKDLSNNPAIQPKDNLAITEPTVPINDADPEDKTIDLKEDEISIAQEEAARELLAVEEEITEEEILEEKWSVGPRIAPVFFSSLSQGSPIHSSFENNAKSGNVNVSYGLAVSYKLNPRLSLRSGIHKVDYGYDTKDVTFSSSLSATNGTINNIDYTLNSRNLVVRSNAPQGKFTTPTSQDFAGPNPALNGKMIQEFGYLELPVELAYALVDKKLSVQVAGGISSLFLVNNSVILESDGNVTEMGEANNLNDVNISTNFGIGVSYKLNKQLQLSVEPMFKYQLNTFSEAAGNFQPFSMGIYSGLNFKF